MPGYPQCSEPVGVCLWREDVQESLPGGWVSSKHRLLPKPDREGEQAAALRGCRDGYQVVGICGVFGEGLPQGRTDRLIVAAAAGVLVEVVGDCVVGMKSVSPA